MTRNICNWVTILSEARRTSIYRTISRNFCVFVSWNVLISVILDVDRSKPVRTTAVLIVNTYYNIEVISSDILCYSYG